MRLFRGLAGSSLLALVFAGAALLGTALCAFAQTPSSPPAVCPECARFVSQYNDDSTEQLKAYTAAREAPSNQALQAKAEVWRKALEEDSDKIEACVLSCKKRDGIGERVPFPPLPPEIPRVNHFEPIAACPACAAAARNALDKLNKLMNAEYKYMGSRRFALENEAWLKVHARERDTKEYDSHFVNYVRALHDMSLSEAPLGQALADYAAAMFDLKNCNSRLCKDLPRATLVGPWDAPVATADCPVCEEFALDLEIALLRLHDENVRLAELVASGEGTSDFKFRISRDEAEARKKRAALDDCNIQFPAASCKPPTTTGQNTLSGGAAGPQGTTGQSTLPGGPASSLPVVTPAGPGTTTNQPSTGPGTKTDKDETDKKKAPEKPSTSGSDAKPQQSHPSTGMLPVAPGTGTSIALVNGSGIGMAQPALNLANSFSLLCRSPEGPPKIHRTRDIFDFDVPHDALPDVLGQPFIIDPHIFVLPDGKGYSVSSAGGANPGATWSALQGLLGNGKITNLATVPCRHMEPESGSAAVAGSCALGTDGLPAGAVHVSGSFGATLLGSDGQPVPGAYVIYGPPSPTPFFNPGERPGDDQPPTIVRTGSDGIYKAPLAGFSGPIEIGVAKGCDAYTTGAIVDGPSAPVAGGATTETAAPLAILRNDTPAAATAAGRPGSKLVIPRDAAP